MTSRVSGETQTCVRLAVNATTSGERRPSTENEKECVPTFDTPTRSVSSSSQVTGCRNSRENALAGKNPETQEGSEPRASQPDPERLLHRFQHEV